MIEKNENTKPVKSGNKRTLITVVIALAAVAVLAAAGASILLSSPLALVGTGAANSVAALEKSEAAVFFEKLGAGGSVELSVGLEELLESVLGFSIDAAADLKLYSNGDDGAALTADVKVGGTTFLDAVLTATKKELAITSDALLGDAAYGIDLEKAAERFEESVFGPNGEYSLGIASLDGVTENAMQGEQMNEEAQEVGESFLAVLMDSLSEYAQTGKENKQLDFNGEKIKTTAVEIVLDSEAMANVAGDIVEYLYTDKEFEQFLRTYDVLIVNYLMGMDLISYYEDPEEFVDDFYDSLEEAYTDIDDFKEEIADGDVDLTAVFYVTKSDKELIGVDLAIERDGEEIDLSVLAGPSIADLREIKIRADDGQTVLRLVYSVDTNDKTEYVANFTVREDSADLISGEIGWDKKSGDFALTICDEYGDTIVLNGALEMSKQSVELLVEEISNSDMQLNTQFVLTLNASDKMPLMPGEYTDILTMTESEIENLTQDLAAQLMGAVYSLDADILGVLSQLFWLLG